MENNEEITDQEEQDSDPIKMSEIDIRYVAEEPDNAEIIHGSLPSHLDDKRKEAVQKVRAMDVVELLSKLVETALRKF